MTDIIIIGAGPAGLTAAIYAARSGMTVKVFDKSTYGGQTVLTSELDNYPGLPGIDGPEFAGMLYKHATDQGAEIILEEVVEILPQGEIKKVITTQGEYEARALIMAGGAKRKQLGCQGEEKFVGRGVSYCATCDAAFFRGKDVAIVGGGDTALNDALFLSNHCNKVYIVVRRDIFRAQKAKQQAVAARHNIEILYSSTVSAVEGDTAVESLQLNTPEGKRSLPVSGVFVAIGVVPETDLYKSFLHTDEEGYIIADENCTTEIEGLYVAGDIRKKPLRQVITAAADGAVAAVIAAEHINDMYSMTDG